MHEHACCHCHCQHAAGSPQELQRLMQTNALHPVGPREQHALQKSISAPFKHAQKADHSAFTCTRACSPTLLYVQPSYVTASTAMSAVIMVMLRHVMSVKPFWVWVGTGGEAEMRRAHDEAVDAIFRRKVKAHHHMQAYISRKTGKTKWGELEMWPVHVSLPAELYLMGYVVCICRSMCPCLTTCNYNLHDAMTTP